MADEVKELDNKEPIKADVFTPDQVRTWLSRVKTASKFHRKEMIPKYRVAKKRYNSEIGFNRSFKTPARHRDINLLYKDVRDFNGSIFFRNPQIDLTSRNEDEEATRRIENLEQIVNDDIKDDQEFKRTLRSTLIDENLSGMGAVYIDYDYRDQDLVDGQGQVVPITGQDNQPIPGEDGQPMPKRDPISNRVQVTKILPENLIRPPWIRQYNYKSAPYLGYVDIVPLERLRADTTLDQEVVGKLEGQVFKNLMDTDIRDLNEKGTELEDMGDILHVKVYTVFIKGDDGGHLKRLVIAEDTGITDKALAFGDWDKGHGKDGKGYPIHVLMLNEAADGFLPPSEAWILESILQIIDYIFEKMDRHLRKSTTKTFFREGAGGLKKAALDKALQNINQNYIGIKDLPPNTDLRAAILQISDIPLSGDHVNMFALARQIFDNLSRQPSFAQSQILTKKKTARETEAIERVDVTENGDYIDKFRDFLTDLLVDWARLVQNNLQATRTVAVENDVTGQKETREVTKTDLQGDFGMDINVNSFLPPNRERKRQILKEALADLTLFEPGLKKGRNQINWKKATREYVTNLDIRDGEDMVIPIPVRLIDQQVTDLVFHGIPFNPEELGQDTEDALQRLMAIFADGIMMNTYEQLRPGVSGPEGEIVQMIKLLVRLTEAKKQGGQQTVSAPAPNIQGVTQDAAP